LGDLPADDAPAWIALLAVLHLFAVALIIIFALHYIPGVPGGIVLLALLAAACGVALRLAKGVVIAILFKLNMRRAVLHG
jgi:uncharacterized protein (DUF983 family)